MSSRVRLVVVMDPIEAIKPAKDSTLAILLAAQARGWQLRNRSTFGCATASPGGVWRRCKCLTIPEHGLCEARPETPDWVNST